MEWKRRLQQIVAYNNWWYGRNHGRIYLEWKRVSKLHRPMRWTKLCPKEMRPEENSIDEIEWIRAFIPCGCYALPLNYFGFRYELPVIFIDSIREVAENLFKHPMAMKVTARSCRERAAGLLY